ncbi:MAG TPA: hypothetical protein VH743_18365 [Beijerinckiaceae bacterium]
MIGAFIDQFGPQPNRAGRVGQNANAGRSTAARGDRAKGARGAAATRDTSRGSGAKQGNAAKAASLGKLNAAHASQAALAQASPNSAVGQIAAYKAAVERGDLDKAAAVLAGLANKDITASTVAELNGLLGVTLTEAETATVAQQARDQQTRESTSRGVSGSRGGTTKSRVGTERAEAAPMRSAELGRMNAAHASVRALDHAAPHSAVGHVAAYQQAVLNNDLDKAAAVLATSNKSVSAESVRGLNGLLGITLDDKAVTEVVAKAHGLQQEPLRR